MTRAAGVAILGGVMALTAPLFDAGSLALPGIALLLLALGSAVWVALAAHGAGVDRTLGPATVAEGDPYPVAIAFRRGAVPPPGGELRDPLLARPLAVGRGATAAVELETTFERRGRHRLPPATLELRDPLGLARRELRAQDDGDEVLVLPRVDPVLAPGAGGGAAAGSGLDGGAGGDSSARGGLDGSIAELDLDGLRPYREGTPASRIHWPAVARSGEMLERRLIADADSTPLVVLDASRPRSEDALDMAVRAAASLCLHLAHRGGCALLLPGDRRPTPLAADLGGWPALHARLALVVAGGPPPSVARARRAGAVLWVTGGGSPPRAFARAARGGAWLVSPVAPAGARVVFSVAGCSGTRLARAALAPEVMA